MTDLGLIRTFSITKRQDMWHICQDGERIFLHIRRDLAGRLLTKNNDVEVFYILNSLVPKVFSGMNR